MAPRTKRSRDETRELMLEAGAQLVYEAFDAPQAADWAPVAHVRLTDVAARASEITGDGNITTGAIYPVWADQNAYRRDLILHLLSPQQVRNQDMWGQFAALLMSDDRPERVEQLAGLIAKVNFEAVTTDPYYSVMYVLMPYCGDDVLRHALQEYIRAEQGDLSQFYRFGLLAYGRRLRNGLTEEDLARALAALFDGLVLAKLSGRDQVEHQGLELADLLAESVNAIVISFSEPIDS